MKQIYPIFSAIFEMSLRLRVCGFGAGDTRASLHLIPAMCWTASRRQDSAC